MNIDGLGKKVVEKFWDLNLINSPEDIFKLDYDKISNLDGWGKLSVSNLKYSIEKAKEVTLDRFIFSIGIRHIGIENAKLIADHTKTIQNFLDMINKKNINELLNIDGIGETQIQSIKKFINNNENIKVINKLNKFLFIKKLELNKKGKLKGKTFMFTGKLINISRAEAKSLVEKNSGNIVSTVNKKLNFLVFGEKPTNKKIELAKKIGVKVLNQQEWVKLLN